MLATDANRKQAPPLQSWPPMLHCLCGPRAMLPAGPIMQRIKRETVNQKINAPLDISAVQNC